MADYYIIAAGGTGSICASAFIYMAAAGCTDRNATYNILLMDKDEESDARTTCLNLMDTYRALRGQIGAEAKNLILPDINVYEWNFTEEIKDEYCRLTGAVKENLTELTLRKLLNPRQDMNVDLLLNTMYTAEELDVDLNKGFYGHPNIGSPVFDYVRERFMATTIQQADGTTRQNKFMVSLQNALSQGKAYVYLFGSLFGGTGATVIPNVVHALRQVHVGANAFGETRLVLGGTVVMPYFKTPNCADDDIERLQKIAPVHDKFAKQTEEALRYYQDSHLLEKMMNLMLVGTSHLDVTCEHYACGGAQSQHYHMVHMLAAVSACRFFRDELGHMKDYTGATNIDPAGELLLWKASPNDAHNAGSYQTLTPAELGLENEFKKLNAFLRFSIIVAYYMLLKFNQSPNTLKHFMEILGTYKQIRINGRNLSREKEIDADIIARYYQEPVRNAGSFCRSFIRYLMDVSLSGYNWGDYREKKCIQEKGVDVGGKMYYPYELGAVKPEEPGAFNDRWVDLENLTELKNLVETGNPDHIIDNKTLNGILSYKLLDDGRTPVMVQNYPNSISTIYEDNTLQHLGLRRGGLLNHIVNDGRYFFEIYDELYKQCL